MLVRTLRRRSLTASVSLKHTSAITSSSSRTSASVDIKGDDQHGLRGVDYQPSGQQTIRQEAADAVDAAWGPSFAADQDEGTQRGPSDALDGADDVRELPLYLSPESEHWLDWFHVAIRLRVMGQMA